MYQRPPRDLIISILTLLLNTTKFAAYMSFALFCDLSVLRMWKVLISHVYLSFENIRQFIGSILVLKSNKTRQQTGVERFHLLSSVWHGAGVRARAAKLVLACSLVNRTSPKQTGRYTFLQQVSPNSSFPTRHTAVVYFYGLKRVLHVQSCRSYGKYIYVRKTWEYVAI